MRARAGEEQRGMGDVFRLTKTAEGNSLKHFGSQWLVQFRRHIRLDETRRDGVDRNAARREFARRRLREADQASFARRVIALACVPDEAADGGNVDDAAR